MYSMIAVAGCRFILHVVGSVHRPVTLQ